MLAPGSRPGKPSKYRLPSYQSFLVDGAAAPRSRDARCSRALFFGTFVKLPQLALDSLEFVK
jgi:hypothetical protein